MAFWNTTKIRTECQAQGLVTPYREDRVLRCAYELGIGPEAYVTSKTADTTHLDENVKVTIPPGQFGLLTTKEVVYVPNNAIGFISMRASIKFQGLVNVSGFHVDPGFRGPLKFAVYNAGSKDITLDQDERVFMLWFADLNEDSPDPYPPPPPAQSIITSKDVDRLKGEVASPAELKTQVDDIKHNYDKRLESVELKQTILQWLACALIVLILGTMLRTGWFDRAIELMNRSVTLVQATRPCASAAAPAATTSMMVADRVGYYVLGAGTFVGLCSIVAAVILRRRQQQGARTGRERP